MAANLRGMGAEAGGGTGPCSPEEPSREHNVSIISCHITLWSARDEGQDRHGPFSHVKRDAPHARTSVGMGQGVGPCPSEDEGVSLTIGSLTPRQSPTLRLLMMPTEPSVLGL